MFNRREQQALLGLAAALLVGSLLLVGDWFRPAALYDFRVIPRKSSIFVGITAFLSVLSNCRKSRVSVYGH